MIHACGGKNISLIIKTKNEKKVFILGPISDIRIRLSVKNRIFLLKKHTAIQIRKIYSIWFPATADSLFFFFVKLPTTTLYPTLQFIQL